MAGIEEENLKVLKASGAAKDIANTAERFYRDREQRGQVRDGKDSDFKARQNALKDLAGEVDAMLTEVQGGVIVEAPEAKFEIYKNAIDASSRTEEDKEASKALVDKIKTFSENLPLQSETGKLDSQKLAKTQEQLKALSNFNGAERCEHHLGELQRVTRLEDGIDFAVEELKKLQSTNRAVNKVLSDIERITGPVGDVVKRGGEDHQKLKDGINKKLSKDPELCAQYQELLDNAIDNQQLVTTQRQKIAEVAKNIQSGVTTIEQANEMAAGLQTERKRSAQPREMVEKLGKANNSYKEFKHSKRMTTKMRKAVASIPRSVMNALKGNKAAAGQKTAQEVVKNPMHKGRGDGGHSV